MKRTPQAARPQLGGQTTGFGHRSGNGVLDVSLVYPMLARDEIGTLELTQLISPEVDTIEVYGEKLSFPSNLSVPAQTETYFLIVPVSLDKPRYRLSVSAPGQQFFAAVHARFDFKKTVDDLRAGKSFFDIINRLEFRSFTTRELNISQPTQTANVPLGESKVSPKLVVQAKGLPRGYAMLATALTEDRGQFVVTDVKRLLEGEKRNLMVTSSAAPRRLLRTLKKYDAERTDFSGSDFDEMSSVVTEMAPAVTGSRSVNASVAFLPILKPIVARDRSLFFSPPPLTGNLKPLWTRILLSRVETVRSGGLWLVRKTPVWNFVADGFMEELKIPSVGVDPWGEKGRYRWELSYGAGDGSALSANETTHLTKTAIDFIVP